jgi:hypothetical protein
MWMNKLFEHRHMYHHYSTTDKEEREELLAEQVVGLEAEQMV